MPKWHVVGRPLALTAPILASHQQIVSSVKYIPYPSISPHLPCHHLNPNHQHLSCWLKIAVVCFHSSSIHSPHCKQSDLLQTSITSCHSPAKGPIHWSPPHGFPLHIEYCRLFRSTAPTHMVGLLLMFPGSTPALSHYVHCALDTPTWSLLWNTLSLSFPFCNFSLFLLDCMSPTSSCVISSFHVVLVIRTNLNSCGLSSDWALWD